MQLFASQDQDHISSQYPLFASENNKIMYKLVSPGYWLDTYIVIQLTGKDGRQNSSIKITLRILIN